MARITVPLIDAAQSRDKTLVPLCVPQWFLPHLVSYAETLSEVEYFIGTDEQKLAAMYDGEDALIALMFPEDCQDQVEIPYNSCGDVFMPDSPFISWAPNDPFLDPFGIPIGYQNPPWVNLSRAVPGTSVLGLEETDVFTTMLQIIGVYTPVAILEFLAHIFFTGFPRFTVHTSGAGTVELHLLKVPFGGQALINVDNSLTNNRLVELTNFEITDVSSILNQFAQVIGKGLAGLLVTEEIIEVELEGDGEHDINVTMLPRVSLDQLIGFGGGLRSVNFCGDVQGASEVLDIDFKKENGHLYWRKSSQASWIDLGQVDGQDGIDGICPPCSDEQIGYETPVNPDYYVRAARVIAEGVFNDLYRAYFASTLDMEYDAQSLELALPPTLRAYPHIDDALGNVQSIGLNAANWWLSSHDVQAVKQLIVNHASCILFEIMKINPLSFPNSYQDVGSYKWIDYIGDAYALNPTTDLPLTTEDLTLQQISLVAKSLIQELALYANLYPQKYLYAVNYEANLSSLTGVEVANCDNLFGDWCRSFDLDAPAYEEWIIIDGQGSPGGISHEHKEVGSDFQRIIAVRYLLPGDSAISDVSFVYDAVFGDGDKLLEIQVLQGGVIQDTHTDSDPDDATNGTFSHDFEGATGDEIRIIILLDQGASVNPAAAGELKSVEMSGVGVIPDTGEDCSIATWEIFGGGANGEGLFYAGDLTEWDAINQNWVSTTPGTSTHEVWVKLDIPAGSVLTELEFSHHTYTNVTRVASYRKGGQSNIQTWAYTEETIDSHLVYPPGFVGPVELWVFVDGSGVDKSRILSVRAKGTGISPE